MICRRIYNVLDTMNLYITEDTRWRHLETSSTLTFFLQRISDDDLKLSLEYCMKGEKSLWKRIENHSRKEKLIVRNGRENET